MSPLATDRKDWCNRHDQPRGGDRRGQARQAHPLISLATIELTKIRTIVAMIGLRSSAPCPIRTGGRMRRNRLRYGSVTTLTNWRTAAR